MIKRYYPDAEARGKVRAAMKRYEKKEGCTCFKLLGGMDERDISTDSLIF